MYAIHTMYRSATAARNNTPECYQYPIPLAALSELATHPHDIKNYFPTKQKGIYIHQAVLILSP